MGNSLAASLLKSVFNLCFIRGSNLGRSRFLQRSLPPPPMAIFADQPEQPRQRQRPGEDGPDRHL